VTTIPDTPPVLTSVRKAERVYGVSKTKLYEWIGDGRLKARFVGKFIRVHRDDMAAMIEALPRVGE
jgi:excisionase family DNA binding protein